LIQTKAGRDSTSGKKKKRKLLPQNKLIMRSNEDQNNLDNMREKNETCIRDS
jgi:hypothetical protein